MTMRCSIGGSRLTDVSLELKRQFQNETGLDVEFKPARASMIVLSVS